MRAEDPYELPGGAGELDDRVLFPHGGDDRIVPRVLDDGIGVFAIPALAGMDRERKITDPQRIHHVNQRPVVQQRAVRGGDFPDVFAFC